jgi:hypothetical protein
MIWLRVNRTPKNVPDQPGQARAGGSNRNRMTSLEDSVRLPHKLPANALTARLDLST